jgi:hypothetical protein
LKIPATWEAKIRVEAFSERTSGFFGDGRPA